MARPFTLPPPLNGPAIKRRTFFAAKGSRTFFFFFNGRAINGVGSKGPAILEKKYFFTLKEIHAATKIVCGGGGVGALMTRPLKKKLQLPLEL